MMRRMVPLWRFIWYSACLVSFMSHSTRATADELTKKALETECQGDDDWDCLVALATLGTQVHDQGSFENARKVYGRALNFLETGKVACKDNHVKFVLLNNLARVEYELGVYRKAIDILTTLIREFEAAQIVNNEQNIYLKSNAWNNLGLAFHRSGPAHEAKAVDAFKKALAINGGLNNGECWFNLGVSLKVLGRYEDALQSYYQALRVNPDYVPPLINLAALYHEHMMLPEAIENYELVVNRSASGSSYRVMALANLGVAYTEIGDGEMAVAYFEKVLREYQPRDEFDTYDIQIRAQMSVAKRITCDWREFEQTNLWLERNVEERQLARNLPPSLLPFDSLLLPLTPEFRRRIAVAYADQYRYGSSLPSVSSYSWGSKFGQDYSNVGYISYDFNDHPTTHLTEELFQIHDRPGKRVICHLLSYGKDDGSEFRQRIEKAGFAFHNLASSTHEESIHFIRDDLGIEVLVDMQGFTRGGRVEITSAKPAPIVVNYLVFAGTSGAWFIDYFIGDRFASPLAEFGPLFSEKLVIMPHSYQVNSYGVYDVPKEVPSAEEQLRRARFVFANFNKSDKLEPVSFQAWMMILQLVPGSVLWLLEPSRRHSPEKMKETIYAQAHASGIPKDRILFAPRVSKVEHIARHQYANLFLDTFVYGAHSTATDALKGGLPMLTIEGESFANRVGASLLRNVNMPHLITHSVKEFIDTAVNIASRPNLAKALRAELSTNIQVANKMPLFDLRRYTLHLESAFQTMIELKQNLINKTEHIIVVSDT